MINRSRSILYRAICYASLLVFASGGQLNAQDTLLYRDGTERIGTIEEDGEHVIGYRRADQPNGPLYRVKRTRLREIRYADGRQGAAEAGARYAVVGSTRGGAAPDTLVLRDGTRRLVTDFSIRGSQISYRRPDQLEGRTYAIPRATLREVRYADGRHIVPSPASFAKQTAGASPGAYLQLRPQFFGSAYTVGGERVRRKVFEQQVAKVPEAYRQYRRGRSNVVAADIVGAVPGGVFGYGLGRLVVTQETNLPLLLTTGLATAGTFFWRAAAAERRNRAIAAANAALQTKVEAGTSEGK